MSGARFRPLSKMVRIGPFQSSHRVSTLPRLFGSQSNPSGSKQWCETMSATAERTLRVPVVNSPDQHKKALARIDRLMSAGDNADDAELEALTILVERYEQKVAPVDTPDPIEILKFRMAQLGLSPSQAAELLDMERGRVSELLHRRRQLTLKHIRVISDRLDIPPGLLTAPYEIDEGRGAKRRDGKRR